MQFALPSDWRLIKAHPEAFGPSGERLLERLESLFLREFNDPRPTRPESLVEGLIECLDAHGLSPEEVRRTVWAFTRHGVFSFADQRRAEERLRDMFRDVAGHAADSDIAGDPNPHDAPHGVIFMTAIGCDDLFGMGWAPPYEQRESFVVQADESIAPALECTFWTGRTGPVPRTISFTADIEVTTRSQPGRIVFTKTASADYRVTGQPDAEDLFAIPITVMPSDLREGEDALAARVRYEVIESVDDATRQPCRFDGEVRFLLEPRGGTGLGRGFAITAISEDGPVPIPGLLHWSLQGWVRASVMYSKGFFREAQSARRALEDRRAKLVGSALDRIEMAHVPDANGPSTLTLPTDGRVVLVLGASWCGPCKAIDPLVKDYRNLLARTGSSDSLFKVSIENGEELGDLITDPHFQVDFPDGVLSSAQQERLAIEAVPSYVEVIDGTIRSHGVLDDGVLERWKAEAEARAR